MRDYYLLASRIIGLILLISSLTTGTVSVGAYIIADSTYDTLQEAHNLSRHSNQQLFDGLKSIIPHQNQTPTPSSNFDKFNVKAQASLEKSRQVTLYITLIPAILMLLLGLLLQSEKNPLLNILYPRQIPFNPNSKKPKNTPPPAATDYSNYAPK